MKKLEKKKYINSPILKMIVVKNTISGNQLMSWLIGVVESVKKYDIANFIHLRP